MTKAAEPALVLIADDHKETRDLYVRIMTLAGYRVIEAADGAQTLASAAAHAPQLILMDLSMPLLDGWQATRRLKNDPRTAKIPVLVVTAHSGETSRHLAATAGSDGYITKPCMPDQLLREVRRMLEAAQQ